MRQLVAGSRGSKLAMIQTQSIINDLGSNVKIKKISTKGDKITDVALSKVNGKGFFTREIDNALLKGEIDFAVHSLKDLPTKLPAGLTIAAIPKRELPNDALVGPYKNLAELPENAKVGTSSLRRQAELLKYRPDLNIIDLRGNIDTRIHKLSEGKYDAIIVAVAGLIRLGYEDYHILSPNHFIPAVCQGAIAVTSRNDDDDVLKIMSKIEDPLTRYICNAERNFLITLNAGCQIPVGVFSKINIIKKVYNIKGFISSIDGQKFIEGKMKSSISNAKNTAINLAHNLLNSGGSQILESIRNG
ncbi:MAG: hydroxymethylbilane synthase [Promethearchaeota archaeon]